MPRDKCTKRIYPPGLAGIGSAHNCGNPSKGPNAEGEPRCGVHSDAAYARRDAQRKAQEQAERERHARTIATHGGQVFLTPQERAFLAALLHVERNRLTGNGDAIDPLFDKLSLKLARV